VLVVLVLQIQTVVTGQILLLLV
jgi:hypothetical protein